MSKSRKSTSHTNFQAFTQLLEKQVIPWWERRGLEHLAVTESTLAEFNQRTVQGLFSASSKKRVGKKTLLQNQRTYNNVNSYRARWFDDHQAVYNYPALAFVLEGAADFHVADYIIESPPNHFVFFRSNLPRPTGTKSHLERESIQGRTCSLLWFFVPPGDSSAVSYLCHSKGEEHWSEGHHIVHRHEVVHAFKIFVSEVQEQPGSWQQIAHDSFLLFLRLFLREIQEGNFVETQPEYIKREGASYIEQAKSYIRANLHLPLSTSQVASEVYLSRNSFMNQFSRETGQTFHEFLTAERMKKAARLLSQSDCSIGYVSRLVGLKPTRFRIQFHLHFHMTPSEFREQSRKNVQKC